MAVGGMLPHWSQAHWQIGVAAASNQCCSLEAKTRFSPIWVERRGGSCAKSTHR